MNDLNPLSEDDYNRIEAALRELAATDSRIEMAQRAGIDMTIQRQQLTDTRAKLLRLKQVYFPGR